MGKSTLAIIASTALKRIVVDVEKNFRKTTGLSSLAYKKEHGMDGYRRQQAVLVDEILSQNRTGAVIVCSWMERHVQAALEEFSATNPVIHIVRDGLANLSVREGVKLQGLLDISTSILRRCSNFEFFNISESRLPSGLPDSGGLTPGHHSPAPYMTLKRVERHFIKFLYLLMPRGSVPLVESAMPLSGVPLADRRFTYAVTVPLSQSVTRDINIEGIETGADAVEIVVNGVEAPGDEIPSSRLTRISHGVASIRRDTAIPIIYHALLHRAEEPGRPRAMAYLEAVEHGFKLGAEYVTIDLRLGEGDFQRLVQMKGRSKVIGHLHWSADDPPSWKDPRWSSYYQRAQRFGCDVVRLTRPVVDAADNFDIQHLQSAVDDLGQPKLPLAAYNTGYAGRHSACFNRTMTSVRPDSSASDASPEPQDPEVAPALTALQATKALYSAYVFDEMKLYVFGANVGYSMSPAMHNAALAACGIPHQYRPYSTPNISGLRDLISDPYFAGASIGLPFKVEILGLTDAVSPHARAIGAANTLIPIRHLNPDGTVPGDAGMFNHRNRAGPIKALYGENTDWIGILACIRRGLSPANAVRPHTCALVVGAGGMARAAVYALMQLGVRDIAVLNRTRGNAEKLVAHFTSLISKGTLALLSGSNGAETRFRVIESRDVPWPDDLRYPTIFVSCIPTHAIGESPSPDFTLPPPWLNSPTGGVVVELAYKTLKTPLLEQVRREAPRGWVGMDGLDLLPEQGFAQFELFTGRRAPRRLMRRELLRAYPNEADGTNLARLSPRLARIADQEP